MITRTVATVVATPATELQFAVEDFATELATDLLPLLHASAQVDGTSVHEAREQFLSTLRDAFNSVESDSPSDYDSLPVVTGDDRFDPSRYDRTDAEARWEEHTRHSNI